MSTAPERRGLGRGLEVLLGGDHVAAVADAHLRQRDFGKLERQRLVFDGPVLAGHEPRRKSDVDLAVGWNWRIEQDAHLIEFGRDGDDLMLDDICHSIEASVTEILDQVNCRLIL